MSVPVKAAEVPVTLDPTVSTTPQFSLSNGNLTWTYTGNGTGTKRGGIPATDSVTGGKWYWEQTIDATTTSTDWVGLVAPVATTNWDRSGSSALNMIIRDTDAILYREEGWVSRGTGGSTNYTKNLLTWGQGDVIGVAYDADIGALWVSVNGTWLMGATDAQIVAGNTANAVHTGLTGNFTAFAGSVSNNTGLSEVVTMNFGATAFASTPPSGFEPYARPGTGGSGQFPGDGGGTADPVQRFSGKSTIGYEYDALGRLVTVRDFTARVQYSFSYDKAGNRENTVLGGIVAPKLQLMDSSVVEGPTGTAIEFEILINPGAFPDTSVDWFILDAASAAQTDDQILNGYTLATEGVDFPFPQMDTIDIPKDAIKAIARVDISDDLEEELGEVFYVQLTNPVNAYIDEEFEVARGTILDDDLVPFSVTANKASIAPGETVTYTVTRSADETFGDFPVTFEVRDATTGTSLGAPSLAGHTFTTLNEAQTVSVQALADSSSGTFNFTVAGETAGAPIDYASLATSITGATASTTVSVAHATSVAENSGSPLTFAVSLTNAIGEETSVSWSASGQGFTTSTPNPLPISANQTSAKIELMPVNNALLDGDKAVSITLGTVTPAYVAVADGYATGTITDDEVPAPNNIPVAVDDIGANGEAHLSTNIGDGNVDNWVEFNVTANDLDDDPSDVLTVAAGSMTNGDATYEAPVGYRVSSNGQMELNLQKCGWYKVAYKATDGKDTSVNSAIAEIYVDGTNYCPMVTGTGAVSRAPVAEPDTYNVDISAGGNYLSWTYPVAANDWDPDDNDGNPSNDKVHILDGVSGWSTVAGYEAPLSVTKTAPKALMIEFNKCGTYKLNYVIAHDITGATATAIATFNVTGTEACTPVSGSGFANTAPTANPDVHQNVDINNEPDSQKILTFSVLGNDTDPDVDSGVDSLTIQSVSVSNGYQSAPVSIVNNGTMIEVAFMLCGTYQFDYTIADEYGATSSSTLRVKTMSTSQTKCTLADPAPDGSDETPPSFSISDATISEGGALQFTVTKSASVVYAYTLNYSTSNLTAEDDDYSPVTNGQLKFQGAWPGTAQEPEEMSKTITIQTTNDSVYEPANGGLDTINLTLLSVNGGATITDGTAVGTITNSTDAAPNISMTHTDPVEGNPITFGIVLDNPSEELHSVTYETLGGDAVAGVDYTYIKDVANFAPYATLATLSVNTADNSVNAPDKTVQLELTNSTGGAVILETRETATIRNDEIAYSWVTGSWGSCSGGTKTRTVTCKGSDGSTVADSLCVGTKPSTSQACSSSCSTTYGSWSACTGGTHSRTNTTTCTWEDGTQKSSSTSTESEACGTFSWRYSSWSTWQGTCGSAPLPNQTATRTVWCESQDGTTVADSNCSGTKPDSEKTRSCYTYAFEYSSWSAWQGTCGTAPLPNQTRTRTATCVRSPDGAVVADSTCGTPVLEGSRNCYTYDWYIGGWSSWSACTGQNTKTRSRSVYCQRSPDGAAVADSQCSGTKPSSSETSTCTTGGLN